MWRAEDPSFDLDPLRENSVVLDDETLAFLSLSSDARTRMQLTENEFETRFGRPLRSLIGEAHHPLTLPYPSHGYR